MKQRFTALDVHVLVGELGRPEQRLIGARLQNIYDVNAKTFLFKFHHPHQDTEGPSGLTDPVVVEEDEGKTDAREPVEELGQTENKLFLLVEAGIRFHRTLFEKDKYPLPSPFVIKVIPSPLSLSFMWKAPISCDFYLLAEKASAREATDKRPTSGL